MNVSALSCAKPCLRGKNILVEKRNIENFLLVIISKLLLGYFNCVPLTTF